MIAPFNLTVDQMDDMDVLLADGQVAGEIEEVLQDASGTPVAVAVDFEDELIEDGDDERIVGLERLRLDGDRFASDLDRSDIGSLPEWDD